MSAFGSPFGGGTGTAAGSGIIIDDAHWFADTTARDAAFDGSQPVNTYIAVDDGLGDYEYQRWDGSAWIDVTAIVTGPKGDKGDKGDTGSSISVQTSFAWGDATPLMLGTCPAGRVVVNVMIAIMTPFDGASPSLTIGDDADNSRLMTAAENDPTNADLYVATPLHEYVASTYMKLWITPGGGASAGTGTVFITYSD